MKVNFLGRNPSRGALPTGPEASAEGPEYEQQRLDPKDCELCLCRVKPEETLVEARSGSDVQIDRQTWAWGRKTNRAI